MTDETAAAPGLPTTILLATDLSARCDRALDRAGSLAASWGAELTAVHALEQGADFYANELTHRLPSWRQDDPAMIAQRRLARDFADRKIAAIVERGTPAETVLRLAAEHNAGLIVVGLARDEALGRFGLGDTVDRLVRRAALPVLVVKDRAHGPYGNVLVATDFSDAALAALKTAVTFFPAARITLLNAFDTPMAGMAADPASYREGLRAAAVSDGNVFLAKAGLDEERRRRIVVHAEAGDPAELVRQYVQDNPVDLIVFGTHGHSALFDILIGSTAKALLSALPCDALVVPDPRMRSAAKA
ncbi:MAG: universal stress protein [Bauldia sp.]|nr:universal stress protein [Bauldia sp.]